MKKNILLSAGIVAAIFILSEFSLRLAGFHSVNLDFQPVVYSSGLGWTLKENYRDVCKDLEWEFPFETNSLGFRDREHAFEKDPAFQRILVLGDSFTEGYGMRDENRWASLLEKKNARWEVINLGIRGYDILQEYKLFLKTGLSYHPGLVIQLLNETDYDQTPASSNLDVTRRFRPPYRLEGNRLALLDGAPKDYSVLHSFPGHLKRLLYHSAAVVWLRRRLEKSNQGRSLLNRLGQLTGFQKVRPQDTAVSDYERNYPRAVAKVYEDLAELASGHGFRMLVVWAGEKEAPAGLRQSVKKSGTAEWMEIILPPSLRFRYDPHPNLEGNRLIADRIFQQLKELKL